MFLLFFFAFADKDQGRKFFFFALEYYIKILIPQGLNKFSSDDDNIGEKGIPETNPVRHFNDKLKTYCIKYTELIILILKINCFTVSYISSSGVSHKLELNSFKIIKQF